MNSYIRRTPVNVDQMHSFLKDKQAWENAIAMYQGPDPLDHWYNYVCWYENNSHGDPENKFRETLERCLTLYEHSEYYKQDPRMVRLWVKYINMQQNPLHFYQILYQRGVGRQCACFYINWARCYETINAIKEAESVFSLGFQEKAQPYIELQGAHSKLLYARMAAQVTALLPEEKPTTQQQDLSQQQQHHIAQQHKFQQQQQQQQIHYQQQQHTQIQQQSLQQQQHLQHQQHVYQQHVNYTRPTQHLQHIHAQQQQQHYQQHEAQVEHHIGRTQQQYAAEESQQSKAGQSIEASQTHAYSADTPAAVTPQESCERHEHLHAQAHASESQVQLNEIKPSEMISSVEGVKLPRKFAAYCRNNFEVWKPVLFLEEPADPNRRCHYAKSLVYPGNGIEYSPEEIFAKKWESRLEELKRQREAQAKWTEDQNTTAAHQELHENNITPQHTSQMYHGQGQHHSEKQDYNEYQSETQNSAPEEDDDDANADSTCDEDERVSDEDNETNTTNCATVVHTMDDLEDQIEASTIRFSTHTAQGITKNQTIKIKFKKERKREVDDSLNGANYSSYTIENSYSGQTEDFLGSPALQNAARNNGHSFHPYNIGQTSTPKTSCKRSKSKLKNVNKFQAVPCSNSNSSSVDYGSNGRGGNFFEQSQSQSINNRTVSNTSFNDNANFSFSSATALENSNCSVTSAVARLNFRDATATRVTDFSTYQENSFFATQHDAEGKEQRLKKALDAIERHLSKESVDPFNSELCRAFLTKLDFLGTSDSSDNYKILQTPLPKMQNARSIALFEGVAFNVDKEVGRGSYGSVYKASDASTGAVVALKYQKPPNTWEIYICDQVLKRIKSPHVLPGLMDISTAVIAPNASIIATEFSPYGSLLDINNKIRQATTKVMHESLVMHFSSQICRIIHHLHNIKIIHADIKPDNFLLMRVPSSDLYYPSLRLIDFGCAIDMTLFPDSDKTKFRKVIQTDGFTCVEMQEGRPWSYETDLFCIAGTVHVMLFGEYMQLQKRAGVWDIKQKLPRYLKKHVWTKFFGNMLNIDGNQLPDLDEMRAVFDEEAGKMDSELQNQIRTLSNILHRR